MIKYWVVKNVIAGTFMRNSNGDIMIFMDKKSGQFYISALLKPELWEVVEFWW